MGLAIDLLKLYFMHILIEASVIAVVVALAVWTANHLFKSTASTKETNK